MSKEMTHETETWSIDPTAAEMLKIAEDEHIETAFSRSREIKPCSTGATGGCCKLCAMGPCRLIGKHDRGVCGATRETVAARNFLRQVAAGTAAHSDHGRDVALTLRAIAKGEIEGATIADPVKLAKVAGNMGIEAAGKDVNQLALEVAECALAQFGQQTGELVFISRAPQKRQDLWRKYDVVPRGIDREIVEAMHRTAAGTDQNYETLLDDAIKCALASGWGGSMIATDLQDVLYGTPQPVRSSANLGVLSEDKVNILIHGHEPLLASMIIDATREPEMIALAEKVGATGINVAGICCTANESLMRKGVPPAGNMLHQELAVLTGAVEAMVVDVQCIFQGLTEVADHFHTKLISSSPKACVGDSEQIVVDEHNPRESARRIVREAIENFTNRRPGPRAHPQHLRAARRGLQPRVHPLHARRQDARVADAAQREHRQRPHPRRGRGRGLLEPPRGAGLRGRQRRARAHRQQRARGRDGMRRDHERQARPADPRDDGVRRRVAARGLRDHRHPAGAPHGQLRRQLPHPHGARRRRRHRRPR